MARSLHSSEQNMWSQNLRYDERKRGTVHEDVRMIAYSALATVAVRCVVCLLADTMESRDARRPYKPRLLLHVVDKPDFEHMEFSMLFARFVDDAISSDIGREELMNPPQRPIYGDAQSGHFRAKHVLLLSSRFFHSTTCCIPAAVQREDRFHNSLDSMKTTPSFLHRFPPSSFQLMPLATRGITKYPLFLPQTQKHNSEFESFVASDSPLRIAAFCIRRIVRNGCWLVITLSPLIE